MVTTALTKRGNRGKRGITVQITHWIYNTHDWHGINDAGKEKKKIQNSEEIDANTGRTGDFQRRVGYWYDSQHTGTKIMGFSRN